MKLILTFVLSAFVFPALGMNANAQSPMPHPPSGDYPAHVGSFDNGSEFNKSYRLERNRPGTKAAHREDRLITKGILAPSIDDQSAWQEFLRTADTGLIRLLPRENTYSDEVRKDFNIRGGGAYYSFATLTHEYNYGSDIELQQDNLSVGFAGADYGLMRRLGDVPLETVTNEDSQVYFMATYNPPGAEEEARSEYRKFRKGLTIDGAFYRAMLPVEVPGTYLLRSIVYDKTDVHVAFRVIRKDEDGSVTIAWKLLKKYPAPILIRTS